MRILSSMNKWRYALQTNRFTGVANILTIRSTIKGTGLAALVRGHAFAPSPGAVMPNSCCI